MGVLALEGVSGKSTPSEGCSTGGRIDGALDRHCIERANEAFGQNARGRNYPRRARVRTAIGRVVVV